MTRAPDTRRAARAFEDFTGRKAVKVRTEKIDDGPVVGWEMGPLVGVAYEAVRDGKRDRYFHEFAKDARPRLVAREDGRQLYIAGGKYKVTERGVVDVSPLFVVNPSRRKGKPMARRSTAKRRRRSPGVVVVTRNPTRRKRRMSAAQRAYFGGGHRPRRRRSRGFLSNPHRRRAVRRYRRNPSLRGGGERLMHLLAPAAGIGLGAIGTEILVGYLPLPAQLKTGPMLYVTKGAVGVAAGLLVGTMLKQKRLGKYIAAGAVAIAVHDGVKSMIIKNMPSVKFGQFVPPVHHMGGLGYSSPASLVGFGEFVPPVRHMAGLAGDGTGNNGGGGETNFMI
jgi:hypothetical protein